MNKKQVLENPKIKIDENDIDKLNGYSWHINSNGYLMRNPKMFDGKYEKIERYFHRIIVKAGKKEIIDHINRDRLDNRRINLRSVTERQSALNKSTKLNKNTGVRGVRKVGNKYRVYVSKNNKQVHLGYFTTLEEATKIAESAYDKNF